MRDFICDEDRCRVYVRDLPSGLACLTTTAVSIIRSRPRFRYVQEANRHCSNRTDEALALSPARPG